MPTVTTSQLRPLYAVKADLFKGLAHPLRIRILEVLSSASEVAVGTLISETGMQPSHLSQQLAVLRRHRLVLSERRASQAFYRLAYPQVADLLRVARELLGAVLADTDEQLRDASALPPVGAAYPAAHR